MVDKKMVTRYDTDSYNDKISTKRNIKDILTIKILIKYARIIPNAFFSVGLALKDKNVVFSEY